VAVNPSDTDNIPWQDGCGYCERERRDPQPGFATWLMALAGHMERDHDIELVGAG
jgi:hypothetical protein